MELICVFLGPVFRCYYNLTIMDNASRSIICKLNEILTPFTVRSFVVVLIVWKVQVQMNWLSRSTDNINDSAGTAYDRVKLAIEKNKTL